MSKDFAGARPDVGDYDDGEDFDASDRGPVKVDDDVAEELFLKACAAAARAGF